MVGPATQKLPASSPASGSKPVSGGLKDQWGLTDAPPLDESAKSEQEKQFVIDFKAIIGPPNESLRYTTVNAEKTRQQPYLAERATIYQYFQTARKRIDPKDPSVARNDIDVTKEQARRFAARVSEFKQATEKSVNAWLSKQPEFEHADSQIDELEKWDSKTATAFRTTSGSIRTATNDRRFDDAVKSLDQLRLNLKPAYEEYQRQKAAQATFEPNWKSIKVRVEIALKPEEATTADLKTSQQQLKAATEQIDKAVAQKDYASANAVLDKLSPQLDQFERKSNEYKTAKAAYEARWPTLKAAVENASKEQLRSDSIETSLRKLKSTETSVVNHANSKDYVAAVKSLDELELHLGEFETARKKCLEAKQAYESICTSLKPQLEQAVAEKVESDPAKTAQQSLRDGKDEMLKAETAKDYFKAKVEMDRVSTLLAEFLKVYKQEKSSVKYFKPRFSVAETKVDADVNVDKEILVQFENAADLAADAKFEFEWGDKEMNGTPFAAFGIKGALPPKMDSSMVTVFPAGVETKQSTGIFRFKTTHPGSRTLKYAVNAQQGQDSVRWEVPKTTTVTVRTPEMKVVSDVGKGPFHPGESTNVKIEIKNVNKASEIAKTNQSGGKLAILVGDKSAGKLNDSVEFADSWTAEERWESDNVFAVALKTDHAGESLLNIEIDILGTTLKHSARVKCVSSKKEFLNRIEEARKNAIPEIRLKFSALMGRVADNISAAMRSHVATVEADGKKGEIGPLAVEAAWKALVVVAGADARSKAVLIFVEFLAKLADKTIMKPTALSLQDASSKLPGFKETIDAAPFAADGLTVGNLAQHTATATESLAATCNRACMAWEKWAQSLPDTATLDFDPTDALVKAAKFGGAPLLNPPAVPSPDEFERTYWVAWVRDNSAFFHQPDARPIKFKDDPNPYPSEPPDTPIFRRLKQLKVMFPWGKTVA